MIFFAEVLRVVAISVLVISSSFYVRHLAKTKKQRKLTTSENTRYIIMQIAYLLFAISLLISIFVQ